MTETPLPVQFDAGTLRAAGAPPYRAPGELTTAHPHLDRASGGMINYAAKLGPRSSYRFFGVDPAAGAKPRLLASLPVREPAYMHSFGLTERWIVLAEFPFVVNPLSLALSGRPYIENYRWKPELGTRFTLIDRASGRAEADAHRRSLLRLPPRQRVRARRRGDRRPVRLSGPGDRRGPLPRAAARGRAGAAARRSRASASTRAGKSVESARRSPRRTWSCPRIAYGSHNERPYRYVWGNGTGGGGWLERIAKVDTESGHTLSWSEPGCYPGEPVFVAEPDGADEDAGALLSVVLDARTQRSFLLVLDAADLTSWRARRSPTTSRSASTGSSPAARSEMAFPRRCAAGATV